MSLCRSHPRLVQVADRTWAQLRDYGAMIEEADDDGDTDAEEKSVYDEKGAISEKIPPVIGVGS